MKVKEETEKVGSKKWIQKTNIMASGPITSWEIDGETVETVSDFIFGGSKITADSDCSHEIKRRLLLGRKVMTNLDSIFKSRDIANKGPSSQGYGFSSSHVWMWELDCEESWALRNWCFWTVVLMLLNCGVGEDSWESLGLQGDPPVNLNGNQSWRISKSLTYNGILPGTLAFLRTLPQLSLLLLDLQPESSPSRIQCVVWTVNEKERKFISKDMQDNSNLYRQKPGNRYENRCRGY